MGKTQTTSHPAQALRRSPSRKLHWQRDKKRLAAACLRRCHASANNLSADHPDPWRRHTGQNTKTPSGRDLNLPWFPTESSIFAETKHRRGEPSGARQKHTPDSKRSELSALPASGWPRRPVGSGQKHLAFRPNREKGGIAHGHGSTPIWYNWFLVYTAHIYALAHGNLILTLLTPNSLPGSTTFPWQKAASSPPRAADCLVGDKPKIKSSPLRKAELWLPSENDTSIP